MSRLGLPGLAALPALALLVLGGSLAPATAVATVTLSGVVTVGGVPAEGARLQLQGMQVTTGADGRYSAQVAPGTSEIALEVSTPHVQRDTDARYLGTVDLTGDRTLDLALPADRATTMTVTEADRTTPVVRAEWSLALDPGVKLLPALGPFHTVTGVRAGSDDAVSDSAGRVRFYVPGLTTENRQTAVLTAYDYRHSPSQVSTQVAYPDTPDSLLLAFPSGTVPSAPLGLAVTGLSPTAATFTWSPPADEGGGYVTEYRVTYGQTGAQGTVVTVPATSSTPALAVTGLVPGRSYSVDVRARNVVGLSSPAWTSFTTPKYAVHARVQSASQASPVSGQPVTLTIDVAGGGPSYVPTGSVTVYDGGVALGVATLSGGKATFARSFLTGTHTLTVRYSGDPTHLSTAEGGSAPASTLVVTRAGSTTSGATTVTGKGQTRDVALRVDVRSVLPGGGTPSGTVAVRDSVSGATRTLTLSGGTVSTSYLKLRTKQTVTFTLTYGGGAEHLGSSTIVTVKL